MPVVGQVDGLPPPADGFHDAAGGAGAGLVEGLEDVVAKERKRCALRHKLLVGRRAQGQVKLEACALRHFGRALADAVAIDGKQDLGILVNLRAQRRISALGEAGKALFRRGQHPAAVTVAIAPDGLRGEAMTQRQLEMFEGNLLELKFQRRLLLDQCCNPVVALDLRQGLLGPCAVLNGPRQRVLGMGKIGGVAFKRAVQRGKRRVSQPRLRRRDVGRIQF